MLKFDRERLASPLTRLTDGATTVPSIENATVPVGVPPAEVTRAVNVTSCPTTEGSGAPLTEVIVTAGVTTWFAEAAALAAKLDVPT